MAPSSEALALIDLGALAHNYREVLRLAGRDVDVLAMVKADAYGHGAGPVAACLARCGCARFGVATLAEATVVRAAVPEGKVVVFGGILATDAAEAAALDVEVVTQEREVVEALGAAASALGRDVAVHVKVDTGMHRLGATPADAAELAVLVERTQGVRPVALCSHFAMAESVTGDVTAGQLEALLAAARMAADRGLRLERHLANSAAVMTRPEAHLDAVRPGLMLYGLLPDPALAGRADLEPVMTLEAPVVRVARVGPGEGIGYGHTYHAREAETVATLRCGYADGYPRALSNRGEVLLDGQRRPVRGRVCMDHTMISAGAELTPVAGDRAIMWGRGLPCEEVARRAETISYELVARVGARVRREYAGEGEASERDETGPREGQR